MNLRIVSLLVAALSMAPLAANAALIQVDFSLNSTGWYNGYGTPFSMGASPSLSGSLLVDNEQIGAGSLLDVSFTTGTASWTRSDLVGNNSDMVVFDDAGAVSNFNLYGFSNSSGYMSLFSFNTFLVQEFATGEFNFCNGCVSFSQRVVASSVPEPSTVALLGIGLLGLALRRRAV